MADHRDARIAEQALDRAVLTVGAVQNWKDHVERAANRITIISRHGAACAVGGSRYQRMTIRMRQQSDLRTARYRLELSRSVSDPSPTSRSAQSAARFHARRTVLRRGRRL